MAAPQVLPPSPHPEQQEQQLLLQRVRRDLNRLSDSNRATRLHGVKSILSLYSAEVERRNAAGCQNAVHANADTPMSTSTFCTSSICAYSRVFMSTVYASLLAVCVDEASESCRAAALELLRLMVKKFLSREEVVALCQGTRNEIKKYLGSHCGNCYAGARCLCCNKSREEYEDLTSSRNTNPEAAKPLVVVLAERLAGAYSKAETSEELRFVQLQLLQHLVVHYAADPPATAHDVQHLGGQQQQQMLQESWQGWSLAAFADSLLAGVGGALKDKSPSNAIEACRLLSAIAVKLQGSILLQVKASLSHEKLQYWCDLWASISRLSKREMCPPQASTAVLFSLFS